MKQYKYNNPVVTLLIIPQYAEKIKYMIKQK